MAFKTIRFALMPAKDFPLSASVKSVILCSFYPLIGLWSCCLRSPIQLMVRDGERVRRKFLRFTSHILKTSRPPHYNAPIAYIHGLLSLAERIRVPCIRFIERKNRFSYTGLSFVFKVAAFYPNDYSLLRPSCHH